MTARRPTALIADDEPLLRDALARLLAKAWPELRVVAQARNGREAVEQFEAQQPDICFLDVHMPGMTGVEAAQLHRPARAPGLRHRVRPVRRAGVRAGRARLPGEARASPRASPKRSRACRSGCARPQPAPDTEALLRATRGAPAARLRRRHRCAGFARRSARSLRLIPVDDIDFLRSDEKYTLVAWRGDGGQAERGAHPHAAEGTGGAARCRRSSRRCIARWS